ncbi:Histidinol-phosphatase [Pseudovibrio axinellae]|uniref:Histidinol-phosphatase n=1 Tax=Pseudovibrio axinellae TaxID=989403 RepID=A0A161XG33_9HYPH|nr:histidinol-phosphatase [Pseudovibrio axinellae]KZL20765.1 Histidinol-phosphatase [Pseudovibrio axinellae]SER23312.1 myo-inositol-1(or 4)-monophosphatase [Pseudovibrio axinellae]
MTSSNPDYAFLHKLADAADAKTMQHFRSGYEVINKLDAGFDPVTIADRSAEEAIRAILEVECPDHGIIGEEFGMVRETAENVWVLDPVDGTRSFICGTPLWGTLIGLRTKGKAVQGIMSQPYNGERFWGNCEEAFMKGPLGERALKTRSCASLSEAVITTTEPALFSETERPLWDTICDQARLTRYSTDCYGYAMLAAAGFDAVVETGMNTYDILALIPIVEGAGGFVTNWTGGNAVDGGQVLATGDKRLHDELLTKLATAAV